MGFWIEPKDLISQPTLSWLELLLQRGALPLLWLGSLAGLSAGLGKVHWGTRVLVGAVLFTLPIQLFQVLGWPVGSTVLGILFGLGWVLSFFWSERRIPAWRQWNWRSALFPSCVWLFFVAIEAPTRLPAFGDPLAFLVYAKALITERFQPNLLEPSQIPYPDLLLHHLAGLSVVLRQDPIDSLMGLSPWIATAAVLAWVGLARRVVGFLKGDSNFSRWDLLIALFAIASARNPLRYGIVAGRLPYLLAFAGFAQLCSACIDLVVRDPESSKKEGQRAQAVTVGLLGAFVFLAHASFLPLLAAPFLLLARFQVHTAGIAAATCLLAVLPRAALLIPGLKNFSARVETLTQAWTSAWDLLGGIRLSLHEFWASIAVSPVCQILLSVALLSLLWKRPKFERLGWLIWPLAFILFWGASGLTETLGLKMFSSHYGARHLGLLVMVVMTLGLGVVVSESGEKWRGLRWIFGIAMVGHLVALGSTFVRERFAPSLQPQTRQVRADAMAMLQAMIDEEKRLSLADAEWIQGVLPPVRFNPVIPFALVQGDVEYFPYFLPEKRLLLTFVSKHALDRSIPEHIALARQWQLNPSRPDLISQLKDLRINLIWLPDHEEFAATLAQVKTHPEIYREWKHIGREWVFELR